nr:hypothetical protein [Jannaschia marina]
MHTTRGSVSFQSIPSCPLLIFSPFGDLDVLLRCHEVVQTLPRLGIQNPVTHTLSLDQFEDLSASADTIQIGYENDCMRMSDQQFQCLAKPTAKSDLWINST